MWAWVQILSFRPCVCVCACVCKHISHIYYIQYNAEVCLLNRTYSEYRLQTVVHHVVCPCVHGSVPDLKEAVPGPSAHCHAVISHTQAAHTIVMASQDSCRRDKDRQKTTLLLSNAFLLTEKRTSFKSYREHSDLVFITAARFNTGQPVYHTVTSRDIFLCAENRPFILQASHSFACHTHYYNYSVSKYHWLITAAFNWQYWLIVPFHFQCSHPLLCISLSSTNNVLAFLNHLWSLGPRRRI